MKIILASGSPRRRELLEKMAFSFDILPADCDEDASGTPREVALELAVRKANVVRAKVAEGIIIGADTLVALGDRIFGKPEDDADAAEMLRTLSGKTHQVYTGLCALDAASGRMVADAGASDVTFRELSPADIDNYVRSGEPMGKAGAYAIQGGAGEFVTNYTGEFSNIMGLPCELLIRLLDEMRKKDGDIGRGRDRD